MDSAKRGGGLEGYKFVLLIGASLLLFAAVCLYSFRGDQVSSDRASSGFSFNQASPARSFPAALPSLSPQSSPRPVFGSLGSLSAPASVLPGGAPAASQADALALARRHEMEFLPQHRAELARYHEKLGRITDRYYKQYPVVRDVDRAFAGMSRYMEVKQRYEKDGDPYQFLRGAIALPEVRAEIGRRLADPEAWKASLGMISDALKDPPPPALYGEAQRFMMEPDVNDYMTEFTAQAQQNAPSAAIALATSNTDLGPIMKVVKDVAPQSVPGR